MFYSGGAEAGLTISPTVEKRLKDSIDRCIVCNQEPAPSGIDQRRALAKWAEDRVHLTTASDEEEDAHSRAALHSPYECASCMSQLHRVIGVPTNALVPLAARLRAAQRADLIGFLQTRFVFVMCEGCASRGLEQERISVPEIELRYDRMQSLLAGTSRKPPLAAVRQFNEIREELRVVIRQLRGVA